MYFTLSQIQYLILAVFGGLIMLLIMAVAYWSFKVGLMPRSETKPEEENETAHEFNDGLAEGNRPVPLFIILVFLAVLLWGVMYVIAVIGGWIHVQ